METTRNTCLLLALLLLAAGCGGSTGSEEDLYVFLPRSLDSQFWVDAEKGLEAEAEELGVSGVPAFIADRRAVLFGVQTAAALAALVARVRGVKGQSADSTTLQHLPVSINRREQNEE